MSEWSFTFCHLLINIRSINNHINWMFPINCFFFFYQNWFSSAWGCMHPSMCLLIIYVVIWQGSLGINVKFWLVLTWSGFCHIDHHCIIQKIIKHGNSKQTSLVQVTLGHDNYLASSGTGEYWHHVTSTVAQPWVNILL